MRASAMERARALMGDSSMLMVDAATGMRTRAGRGLPRALEEKSMQNGVQGSI